MSGKVGVIVSRRLATLYELDTVYSYEDMLDLYEIVVINNINEQRAWKEGRNNGA